MQDQPQLPFGDDWNLQQIRKLLEVQNELLRELLNRLGNISEVRRVGPFFAVVEDDSIDLEDLAADEDEDEDDDEDSYDPFEEDEAPKPRSKPLQDPPVWFSRHFWEGL